MIRRSRLLFLTASCALLHVTLAVAQPRAIRLPLAFVETGGRLGAGVAFVAEGREKTVYFEHGGLTVALGRAVELRWAVKVTFVGARAVVPRGRLAGEAVFSYFRGAPEAWRCGLRSYGRIVYEDLWPGIDLVYEARGDAIKYAFRVRPGADPGLIRLRYRGAERVWTDADGALRIETPNGSLRDDAPLSWLEGSGARTPVTTRFSVRWKGDGVADVRFAVSGHDPKRMLVIDPTVVMYCGYLGGAAGESIDGCAVDASGNLYVCGWTKSSEATFPASVGPNLAYGGQGDVFVAKVDPTGKKLLYCGYLGGAGNEIASDIAVDGSGSVYLTGRGAAPSYPIKNGFTTATGGIFVTKLDPAGTGLVYSGFFGGNGVSNPGAIAVDGQGNAFVTGSTEANETTFPVIVGPDLSHNGLPRSDCFVAKLNAAGSTLLYCGYVGGLGDEMGTGIAVDPQGRAYVTGWTYSDETTFPAKVGPFLKYHATPSPLQQGDVFIARVDATGTSLEYCGYIGGFDLELSGRVAVDVSGAAYVTGSTYADQARSFPVTWGPDLTHNGGKDAFIAKIHPTGASFVYCGYVGGEGGDEAHDVAIDASGAAYVTGVTGSRTTFPLRGGLDTSYNGNGDVFVTKIDPTGTRFVLGGYLGGTNFDVANAIGLDATGNIYLAGQTQSDERSFPVVVGPDLTYNDACCNDAFVAKIAQTFLTATGTTRPGDTVAFDLVASRAAGRTYQTGSSLGTGPITIDTRTLALSLDPLLDATVNGTLPSVFLGYRGVIGANGRASARLAIPSVPALVGLKVHTAFVTVDPAAPSGVLDISDTWTFTVG